MKVDHFSYELPFVYPFTISKGTKTHQPTFIVCLRHFGLTGYGEAPAIHYYNISTGKMAQDLESKRKILESFAFTGPERYWHFLHHLFPANPFLVCALDMAGWDLWGKLKKLPLYKLWGLDRSAGPLTDYTIGIDNIETMVKKVREKSWPIYKIKVGGAGDLDALRAIRSETSAILRVDANAGWTLKEANKILPELRKLDVELVEQPLDKDDAAGMTQLFAESSIPLFADESCVSEADVVVCAAHFHGINIKLTKCSGLTPALRMIREARGRGLKVMAGGMNESSIGTAAVAHLNPLLDLVDMDGPLLLAEDLAEGLSFADGRVTVSNLAGLGVVPLSGSGLP